MLSLRPVRRFCRAAAAIPSSDISPTVVSDKRNQKPLEEPALVKLKAERDPEKLFHLFAANARNRLVVENRFAFEDTVSRLAGARRFDYIENLLEQQKALPQGRREGFMIFGIVPDEVTYNLVIKGFFMAGFHDMAKRVYSNLHGRGFKPNIKIYQTMIHYLCKGGDFSMAYTMCKDCMSKNWFPSVDTIYILLEGLKKNGQIGRARLIIALARNKMPPFSSSQVGELQDILAKS